MLLAVPLQNYVNKLIAEVTGMKVLLLDSETVQYTMHTYYHAFGTINCPNVDINHISRYDTIAAFGEGSLSD